MKIISNFKDYYDGGAVYGIDKSRIYVRKTKILDVPKIKTSNHSWSKFIRINYDYDILGFCGEIYLFNNYSERDHEHKWIFHPKKYILWGKDAIKYRFEKLEKPFRDPILVKKKKDIWRTQENYDELKNSNALKSFFLKYRNVFSFLETFI